MSLCEPGIREKFVQNPHLMDTLLEELKIRRSWNVLRITSGALDQHYLRRVV